VQTLHTLWNRYLNTIEKTGGSHDTAKFIVIVGNDPGEEDRSRECPSRCRNKENEFPIVASHYQNKMCRLRKKPQGERSCALKGFGMKIPTTLLFERNDEGFTVEFATRGPFANNWTKPGDE
jgi:hypothetical protein